MTWLVTGGAGYIGAHVVTAMLDGGDRVVVVDDLSTGDRSRIPGVPLVEGSVLDQPLIERVLREHEVTGVVHIAGKKQVEESVRDPLTYYRENVEGLRRLLEAVSASHVGALVREDIDCRPVNPYGETKLICEHMVADLARATGLRYVNLRYFNVAGTARPELADHGESNLVPMVFRRISDGRAPLIFGDDFPTPDGTCIRNFIHVADIASAHVAAARAMAEGRLQALTANVGRGKGVSVREMIAAIREVTGTAGEDWAEPVATPRRAGDPPRVVAAADTIRAALGWKAQYGLKDMVTSAWDGWTAHLRTAV
jgi:UDP-glucose 4-epimerase